MGHGSCPTEKTSPEPLLGDQKKPKGAISVTIPPEARKSSKPGLKGSLSPLEWAHRWAVQSVIFNLILILILLIIIIAFLSALKAKKHEMCPAACVYTGATCPNGWIGYLGKCYYFFKDEKSWTASQSNCSAYGASLAVIDTQDEMDFMKRNKEPSHYWIGLRRDPGQSWKWTNGTEFNKWFSILGEEKCAFLNDEVGSSGCSSKDPWICSKPMEKMEGKAK